MTSQEIHHPLPHPYQPHAPFVRFIPFPGLQITFIQPNGQLYLPWTPYQTLRLRNLLVLSTLCLKSSANHSRTRSTISCPIRKLLGALGKISLLVRKHLVYINGRKILIYCKASELRSDAVHSHGPEAKHWIAKFFPSEETLDHVRPIG